jgi:hypothetical protein
MVQFEPVHQFTVLVVNIMPIIQMGLEPVPVDCAFDTLNVSSVSIQGYYVPIHHCVEQFEAIHDFFLC